MDNNLEKMLEKYPFLAVVRYAGSEYVCVIQNQDGDVTTVYDYAALKTVEHRQLFLELAETWWWESNRMIPINIFIKDDWKILNYCSKTFISKEVEIVSGHCVKLDELSQKRTKRKSIQLIKRMD